MPRFKRDSIPCPHNQAKRQTCGSCLRDALNGAKGSLVACRQREDALRKDLANVTQAARDNHDSFLMQKEKVKLLETKLTAAEKENAEFAAQLAQAGELMELVDRATYLVAREPETDNWHLPAKRILSRPAPEALKRLREGAKARVLERVIDLAKKQYPGPLLDTLEKLLAEAKGGKGA